MVLLSRAEGVVELRVNGVFVMDSVHTGTEHDLAAVGLALCPAPSRVLVGGLGLGYTARACLEDPRVERVTVVEIEQPVADWVASGLVPRGRELASDPRLDLVVADLADHVRDTRATYDVVLLDIDNGPGNLVHPHNERVYGEDFLRTLRAHLEPGGVVALWSASASPALESSLATVFAETSTLRRAVDLQGRDEQYFLYTGRG